MLYKTPQSFKIILYLVYGIEFIINTTYQKEEVNIKPYVTTVIKYMWYVYVIYRSFIRAQIYL